MVSVIIPMFNSEKFLSESVRSIFQQTLKDFELLLVDDNSTDNTFLTAQSFLVDKRVFVYKNIYRKGISGAVNTGLEIARGKYIAYLDHDDIALPERLESQVSFLENHQDIGACGTWMEEFGKGNGIWSFPEDDNTLKALLLFHSPIANPTAMLRKSIIDKYELRYNSDFDVSQDFEFWLQLIQYTKIANLPEVLVKYRIHNSNASSVFQNMQFLAWKKAISPILKKMNLEQTDYLYETIYEMKYPNFSKKYKSDRLKIDYLIQSILQKNNETLVLPQKSLECLFKKKIETWGL